MNNAICNFTVWICASLQVCGCGFIHGCHWEDMFFDYISTILPRTRFSYRILPNYRTVCLSLIIIIIIFFFSKLLEIRVPFKIRSAENFVKGVINDTCAILFWLTYKIICCWYSFELPRHVEAIQMSTNNICFCKVEDKSTLVVISQKTTKLFDCALIGACAVIKANTVVLIGRDNDSPISSVVSTMVCLSLHSSCGTSRRHYRGNVRYRPSATVV